MRHVFLLNLQLKLAGWISHSQLQILGIHLSSWSIAVKSAHENCSKIRHDVTERCVNKFKDDALPQDWP